MSNVQVVREFALEIEKSMHSLYPTNKATKTRNKKLAKGRSQPPLQLSHLHVEVVVKPYGTLLLLIIQKL